MKLKLTRVGEYQNATYGVMMLDGKPMFVTLEDAWRHNERMVSCIPVGTYKVKRHVSPKFGACFRVEDVPGRSEILIHAGNTHVDTHGCILLGLMFGTLGTTAAILSSRAAMESFLTVLKDVTETTLTITEAYDKQ